MKTFGVDCFTAYGMQCSYSSYDITSSFDIEVKDDVADYLCRLINENREKVTMDVIKARIAAGETILEKLHNDLVESCINMELMVLLEDRDAGLDSSGYLMGCMLDDMDSWDFVPEVSLEQFMKERESDSVDEDCDDSEYDYGYDCEEDPYETYQRYLMDNEYRRWLSTLDLYEHAKKVEFNLDAHRNGCDYIYTIYQVPLSLWM